VRGDDIAHEAGAGGPGAAADRDDDLRDLRMRLEQLEVDRGVTVDHRRFVAWVDEAHAALGREGSGMGRGLGQSLTFEDDLSPEGAHGVDLHTWRRVRDDDECPRPATRAA